MSVRRLRGWAARAAVIAACVILAVLLRPALQGLARIAVNGALVLAVAAVIYWTVKRDRPRRAKARRSSADEDAAQAPAATKQSPPPSREPQEAKPESQDRGEIDAELHALKRKLGRK